MFPNPDHMCLQLDNILSDEVSLHPSSSVKYRQILGIRFFGQNAREAAGIGLKGGLVVVPAAPALLALVTDREYRKALLNADLAITDSGFMVLIWNAIKRDNLRRVSGLEYLKIILEAPEMREPGATFWVMPTRESLEKNLQWLQKQGIAVSEDDCYVAPMYKGNHLTDEVLVETLARKKPRQIVIGLGGGVQEKLGCYLKESLEHSLDYTPGIHCIGAAIAFLSGDQVNIPEWADRYFVGWLFRCLYEPGKFIPRYWKARKLLPLMLQYQEELPPLV